MSPEVVHGDDARKPRTWEDGERLSDLERQQYEFEGGGAASERQVGKRRSWLARVLTPRSSPNRNLPALPEGEGHQAEGEGKRRDADQA